MTPFSTDHSFSEAISKCFAAMGEWQFVNPVSSYPWGGRNRIIARIRVFEKYLKPADVLQAHWLQLQAIKALPPRDTQGRGITAEEFLVRDTGIVHLNKLMAERSEGKFWDEIAAIEASLPSVMEYAEVEYAPMLAQWNRNYAHQHQHQHQEEVKQRRSAMHVVPALA